MAVAAIGFTVASQFQGGRFTCTPKGFPVYGGATVTNESIFKGIEGDNCRMLYESNADVATVMAYYESALDGGDWQVVSEDRNGGIVTFRSRTDAVRHGTVTLTRHGSKTTIRLQYLS